MPREETKTSQPERKNTKQERAKFDLETVDETVPLWKPNTPRNSGDAELLSKQSAMKKKPLKTSAICRRRPNYVDTSPKHRTAMGEYIVPEGGQPLTWKAHKTIGPADYIQPPTNMYKDQSPEWSILNRHIYTYTGMQNPPPNQYTLPDSIAIKNKFTLGKRLKTDRRAIAGACRAGPTYGVKGFETGKNAPKYSVPKAQRNEVITGPPNALVTPTDTPGFRTPGAEVFMEDGVLPHAYHAQITSRPSPRTEAAYMPAPNNYYVAEPDPGLHKSFGITLKPIPTTMTPAPNHYSLGTKVGEGPAYSIRLPIKPLERSHVPSPCAYMKEREFDRKEKITMGYRMIATPPKNLPGPNTYKPERKTRNDLTPWASIKSRNKVPYPASLHSAFADESKDTFAGPAANTLTRLLDDTRDKGVTFKQPFKTLDTGPRPGPSDYGRLECDPLSTKPRAPAYSMRPAHKAPAVGQLPGPSQYQTFPLDPGLAASMKSRHRTQTRQTAPAPNAYIPKKYCTRTGPICNDGISLSSRHSPFVYLGMKQPLD